MHEQMSTPTRRRDWTERVRVAMELFNEERYHLCEVQVRALLADPELPQYYHVQCLVILATCVENWSEGKQYQESAENMWSHMRLVWPVETSSERKNHAFLQLRGMLDDLKEDMDVTKPASRDEDHFKDSGAGFEADDGDMVSRPTENDGEFPEKGEKDAIKGEESAHLGHDDSAEFQNTKSKQFNSHEPDDDDASSISKAQSMEQSEKASDISDHGSIKDNALPPSRIDQPNKDKGIQQLHTRHAEYCNSTDVTKSNNDVASSRSPTKSNRHVSLDQFMPSSLLITNPECVTAQPGKPRSSSSFSMTPFMPELTEAGEGSTSGSFGGSLKRKFKDKTPWRLFKKMTVGGEKDPDISSGALPKAQN